MNEAAQNETNPQDERKTLKKRRNPQVRVKVLDMRRASRRVEVIEIGIEIETKRKVHDIGLGKKKTVTMTTKSRRRLKRAIAEKVTTKRMKEKIIGDHLSIERIETTSRRNIRVTHIEGIAIEMTIRIEKPNETEKQPKKRRNR